MNSEWAEKEIQELRQQRRLLKEHALHLTDNEARFHRSMIAEINEKIVMLQRYVPTDVETEETRGAMNKAERLVSYTFIKTTSWDNRLLTRLADPSVTGFEDEIVERLSPGCETVDLDTRIVDLSRLPRRQREVLEMLSDGLSYRQVGDLLEIERGSVSKHMQLARKRLRRYLTDDFLSRTVYNK